MSSMRVQEQPSLPYYIPTDPTIARIGGRPNTRYDVKRLPDSLQPKSDDNQRTAKGSYLGILFMLIAE
ncbi:hypothetical protein PENSUB_3111 [Penicillium subrubescens]|uniref:Uncharacterized protein n=1 Tax=Penicillium subrubescens TaxID=1316194 RepID=A0A1Q5UG32_9EURO|nr:hypothetical protein PENSUB_3111 [Penicillium subrubescens]